MTDYSSPLADAAHDYVERGLAIIPLGVRNRSPRAASTTGPTTRAESTCGGARASTRQARRPEVQHRHGVRPGLGGIIAIDLDCHSDDANGLHFLRDWEVEHGKLPETWTQITGSGGKQLFYRVGQDVRNSANGEIGVDVRGNGGYVVLPRRRSTLAASAMGGASVPMTWTWPTPMTVYDFIRAVSNKEARGRLERREDGHPVRDKGEPERDAFLARALVPLARHGARRGCDAHSLAQRDDLPPPAPRRRGGEAHPGSINSKEPGNAERDARNGGITAADIAELESRHGPLHGSRGGLNSNVLARMVMDRNMARIIDGAPAVWTGEHWEFGSHAIGKCCLEIADNAKKADKSEVMSYIMDKAPHVSADNSFDGRHYVQFANCTFDVMDWREVEPKPSMYITNTLPVELDFTIGPNEADTFLDSIADGDADVVAALKEVMGACMCSKRVLSQSPMLIGRAGGASGKASNGKSTYLNWLRQILGTENVSSLDIATLGQRFQAGRVVGKLANLGDDIPDGFLKGDELSMFKKLVTGDAIYTDVKNGDGYEFRPTASMVFSMNAVPRLLGHDRRAICRLAFIPFRNRFAPGLPGYDPNMAAKLAKPEVLKRGAALGLLSLGELIERGGLTPIPDMVAEIEEVKQDNDSVTRWLFEECVTVADVDKRPTATVFNEYFDWCKGAGERNPCSLRTFSSRMCGIQALYDNATEGRQHFSSNRRLYRYQTEEARRKEPQNLRRSAQKRAKVAVFNATVAHQNLYCYRSFRC